MENILKQLPKKAKDKENENKKVFKKLRKKPPKHLDTLMVELHDKEFEKTDCLSCANCCKTTAPWLNDQDVARIAKHLKLKEQKFIEQYLEVGEDHEFSFKLVPCVFLMHDNECSIYNVRPKACREYPHTNRRRFHQLEAITIENTAICPATYNIMEALKAKLPIQYSEKGGKPREKFRKGGG
jgi:Fe-S-cluster containining protein